MSAPHFHLDYLEDWAEDAVEDVTSNDQSSVAYAGLSPFDIPVGAEVRITAPSRVHFVFAYANTEPGEEQYRQASHDSTVVVRLGKNTGKILEVLSTNAKADLRDGTLDLDLTFVPRWQVDFPYHAQNTCRRSAFLIHGILKNLPVHYRTEILAALPH